MPKYSHQQKDKKISLVELQIERGANMNYQRMRHSSISDGMRYVYVLGSSYRSSCDKFEIYDFKENSWKTGPDLPIGDKNLSCCYFKTGQGHESLWVFNKGSMYTHTLKCKIV